jgi:uracil-DNA glycosylase family 4
MAYDPEREGAKCSMCPLGGPERNFVPPTPAASGKVKLVIVGEGPGRSEVREKLNFIGVSGKLLDRTLAEAGGEHVRKSAWVTNSSLCRAESDAEKDDAAACCAPRLYKELAKLPKSAPILALGKPAARSILGMNGIQKVRGFVWKLKEIPSSSIKAAHRAVEKEDNREKKKILILRAATLEGRNLLAGRTVLPSIHPAFVLRSDTWLPIFEKDIDRTIRYLNAQAFKKPFPLADETGKYSIVYKASQVKKALAVFREEVAFDIETNGKDPITAPILCMTVYDGKRSVVIQPWDSKKHPKLLSAAFRNRKPGGHNVIAFDMIAMQRDGVVFPQIENVWDSLIAHHAYASHFPQGLSQIVSYYCDASPWKIKFGRKGGDEKGLLPAQMTPEDRAHYNAVDGVVNFKAWRAMQGDLAPEGAIYEHDKGNAVLCQNMQKAGIGVDLEKKEWLEGALRRRAMRLLRRMRRLTGKKSFHPNKAVDIRDALYGRFKAPVLYKTEKTSMPSTGVVALNAIATQDTRAGRLSRFILKFRKALKILSTYVKSIEVLGIVKKDGKPIFGRQHCSWKSFGTVSGRWACRLMTLPRISNPKKPALEDRVRELYVPRRGYVFVYFDLSQAEMRFASQLSGDVNFMKVCSEKDVHSANAVLIFPDAEKLIRSDPKGAGKMFRDIAKNCGFAVNYLASEDTLFLFLQAQKLPKAVPMKVVKQMLRVLHEAFKTHFKYIDANVERVKVHGYMRTPILGRIRWLGWTPKPTEIANLPVQASVADIMNKRLQEMHKKETFPKNCQMVYQGHDAALFECKIGKAAKEMRELIVKTWAEPIKIPGTDREFVMPIDLKEGFRLSEVA